MGSDKYDWRIGDTLPLLEAHSAAKHAVLRSYIDRYITVLTSDPRHDGLNLTLVDGFAGGGAYLFNNEIAPGSPMILLEEVACAQARFDVERTKPFKLNAEFIFVEHKRTNFDFLVHTIRSSQFGSKIDDSVHLLNGDFESELPKIIKRIRSRGKAQRCIFVLDQYGYSDVSLSTIRKILTQLENPEIIITLNVDSLIDYLSQEESFLKGLAPIELDIRHVQEMLNYKNQRHARWVIQNFLYRHVMKQTAAPFYTCFFIKSPASHRSYWLIHISKHPKARDEMALRHWAMSNHFVHHGRAGLRMLGFDSERDTRQVPLDFIFDDDARTRSSESLLSELPGMIFGSGARAHGPPSVGDIFTEVCNETPATMELIGEVLIDLRSAHEVEIYAADGRVKPRSLQVAWTDVILPARQRSLFSSFLPKNLRDES